jgi:predicted CDP-diglyceride synthetase/phosphatidate cytidylyltransferase
MKRRLVNPISALPDNYREVRYIRVTEGWRLIWLNILSLFPMLTSGLIVFGLLILYHSLGAPLVIDHLPTKIPAGLGLMIILLVLPLHELLHGLLITYFGHKARYGFKMTVLYATADGAFFRRNEFIQIALAPLVLISAAGLILMLLFPAQLAQWIALGVVVNAAGAIGDLWMTAVALRFESSALIQDEEDCMRVFAEVPAK